MDRPVGEQVTPSAAARRYIDEAIRRHRESGDDQAVPKDVYQRALHRTAKAYREFRRLGRQTPS
jgi:hypothetical protein